MNAPQSLSVGLVLGSHSSTSPVDLALVIAAELYGDETSQAIQLAIEYQPAPPFDSGSPRSAPREVRDLVLAAARSGLEARRIAVEQAAARAGQT